MAAVQQGQVIPEEHWEVDAPSAGSHVGIGLLIMVFPKIVYPNPMAICQKNGMAIGGVIFQQCPNNFRFPDDHITFTCETFI